MMRLLDNPCTTIESTTRNLFLGGVIFSRGSISHGTSVEWGAYISSTPHVDFSSTLSVEVSSTLKIGISSNF